ncbi:hypothetical protein [Hoeflea sp.]|uniref:hypothetical protein n=1 Tax=Hoeflea sp. TaxID=1940281 RepID=UPI003B02B08F
MSAVERWIGETIRNTTGPVGPLVSVRLGKWLWRGKPGRASGSGGEWRRLVFQAATTADKISGDLHGLGLQRVDILHIAVRWNALRVLEKFGLQRLNPDFVRIHRKSLPGRHIATATQFLIRHGYRTEWIGKELVAIRTAAVAPRAAPASTPQPRVDRSGQIRDAALYVVSMNTPEQFRIWLDAVERACPDLLSCKSRVLQDNSTDPATSADYDALCGAFGFSVLRSGNLGIMGGRRNCAQHFETLETRGGMFWFEDDMLLHPPDAQPCKNGLRSFVPELVDTIEAIAQREELGYLMLSFSEFFGDHHLNWAWHHLTNEERQRDFPNGTYESAISHSGVERGTSYLVGNVHFDNWPSYVSRSFSREMFLTDEPETSVEGDYMARAYRLVRSNRFRGGVLLASPISHSRHQVYGQKERIE